MSDIKGKVSAANSSRKPTLTYAETARQCSNKPASSSDVAQPAPVICAPVAATTAAAAGENQNEHMPSHSDANGSEGNKGAASDAPEVSRKNPGANESASSAAAPTVRLPAWSSASSVTASTILFGSLNQQARPLSPPAEQTAALDTAVIASGSVPASSEKQASKPKTGSAQKSSKKKAAKQPAVSPTPSISGAADSSARPAQHPRKQNRQQQNNSASRSSKDNRQAKGSAPGRKNSAKARNPPAKVMPNLPEPQPQADMGAQQSPLHYVDNYFPQGHMGARFPSKKGIDNPYNSQAPVHYAPHYMGSQPMPPPMGYGMQPMAGWMAPVPNQYAYMHMGGPGFEQYYLASPAAGAPPAHNMYGMSSYIVPNPTNPVPSQFVAPGNMQAPMDVIPEIAAAPMSGLRVSAQAFIPARRPVRIVNPNTNEEIDLSHQRLSSASGATPTPGPAVETCETAATPVEPVLAEAANFLAVDEENIAVSVDNALSEASQAQPESSDAETVVVANVAPVETAEAAAIAIETMIKEAVSEPIVSLCDEDGPISQSTEDDHNVDDESDSQLPLPSSPSGSSLAISGEPSSATRRILTPAEILELYSGDSEVPTLVGEILRYPRVFLDRFNGLCEPPRNFDAKLVEIADHRSEDRSSGMRRSASGSNRSHDSVSQSGFGGMGNFRHIRTPNSFASSDERFRQSTNELRGRMDGEHGATLSGRPPSGQFRGGRTGSTRGGRRGGRGSQNGRGYVDMANVKPLEKSENRYIPKNFKVGKDAAENDMEEDVYSRHMRMLLNKLSLDNFDTVSDELVTWGNKSVNETDARMLRHLVMLVYQKAIDEPYWVNMYARLCHKIICNTDMQIEDHNVLTKDGKYLCGGFLVRKYLLAKCQEDFERGWKVEVPEDMGSDEYYDAMSIKRQGLGLVSLVCELYLMDILKSPILHECIKRLLSNIETPEEEEVLSVVKLITTVGKKLDTPENKDNMNAYFARIRAMSVNMNLIKRIRFALIGVIELRDSGWVVRRANDEGPMTIAEIHEDAERKRQAMSNSKRENGSNGRHSGRTAIGGSSGSGRNDHGHYTGDLTGFGNLARTRQQRGANSSTPGANPFGAFAGGLRGWSNSSVADLDTNHDDMPQSLALGPGKPISLNSSHANSTVSTPKSVSTHNMFDLLENDGEDESLDLETDETATGMATAAQPTMDAQTMQRKIKGMIDEYMSLKDDVEFIECFKELGEANYQLAVFEIANTAMFRRNDLVEQVARGIEALCTGNVLTEDIAAAGLIEFSETLEDVAIDAPNAYKYFGLLMNAANVPRSLLADDVLKLIN